MPQFLVALAISLAVSVIAYLITPKPSAPKPPHAKDLEGPTADDGRPVPVVFGTMTVKGLNVLWYGDKHVSETSISTE